MSTSTFCNRDEILFPVFFTIILKNEPEDPGVPWHVGVFKFSDSVQVADAGARQVFSERSMRIHTVGVFTSIPNGDRRIRSKALTSALHGDKVKQIPVEK